jgi:integrase
MAIEILKPTALRRLPDGKHLDGGGLYLQVSNGGKRRSWIFRYGKGGCFNMGLGSLDKVSLAEARLERIKALALLKEGKDPLQEKRNAKKLAKVEAGTAVTVNDIAKKYMAKIAHRGVTWRRYMAQLFRDYIENTIGSWPIHLVETKHILDEPVGLRVLYAKQYPTAHNLQKLLARMFSMAMVECGLPFNPAAWKDRLEHVLPGPDSHTATSLASLPYEDVPRFLEAVRSYEDRSTRKTGHTTRALLVEFAVVAAAVRISEVRKATWDQFDIPHMVWNVPPENRKGRKGKKKKVKRLPITRPMLNVLEEMQRRRTDQAPDVPVFPGPRRGKILDVVVANQFIHKALKWDIDVTVHGFRSTLTAWALNQDPPYPKILLDRALDHAVGDKVDEAYFRDELFLGLKKMLDHWGRYCSQPAPKPGAAQSVPTADIIQISERKVS